jgi:ribosomal-protein-alanine N-acetyltransferase
VVEKFPSLSGPRLDLIEITEAGLPDMFEYSQDPRLYQYLEFPPHTTLEDTRQYLVKLKSRMADGSAHYWFVQRRDGPKVIGTFGVHGIDWRKGAGELGYGIAPTCWGQGYFTEALELVLTHLFGTLGFHRVAAKTPSRNLPSIRGLQRAGFVEEGRLRDFYLDSRGSRDDAVVMSILARDRRRVTSPKAAYGV